MGNNQDRVVATLNTKRELFNHTIDQNIEKVRETDSWIDLYTLCFDIYGSTEFKERNKVLFEIIEANFPKDKSQEVSYESHSDKVKVSIGTFDFYFLTNNPKKLSITYTDPLYYSHIGYDKNIIAREKNAEKRMDMLDLLKSSPSLKNWKSYRETYAKYNEYLDEEKMSGLAKTFFALKSLKKKNVKALRYRVEKAIELEKDHERNVENNEKHHEKIKDFLHGLEEISEMDRKSWEITINGDNLKEWCYE